MPTSIYKSLNFGDLEPIGMTIQLANRSVVQPLGVLEVVLVQVNKLIFPADFYVLDMEDETSGKGTTLILGRPFLMTTRTKIDVHAGTPGKGPFLFNIFEVMKHPTEDHSLFRIDLIDELVEEYLAGSTNLISCLGSITEEADYEEVHDIPNSEDNNNDIANLDFEAELFEVLDQVCNLENPECANKVEVKRPIQVDQSNPKSSNDNSSSPPPPRELKPLPNHLKYLDTKQKLPVIIANNLCWEQEDKLLNVLRQHKKTIGWKLSNLLGINPSICMHKILMEEEAKPISQHQRRINPTILDVVKKEVMKLLAIGIIYPILDSQWVSLVQVVPKKSGMTVMKKQQEELATYKDHFPLPFIDQVLEKLSGKSHYYFLDGFSGYMQIHIALEDQHKTTFTCPFGTFAYTRMSFGLCNAPSTFQHCMISIFLDLLQECIEVFMDDFMVYADSFDACLENLSKVLTRCIDTNLVLNFEKCHFMVIGGIVFGHLVSNRGIKVDKLKIDIITSLPKPCLCVGSLLDSIEDLSRISARFPYRCPNCYRRMWNSNLTSPALKPFRS
ncbi:Retrovirus-related Pol polyprotein, partial [Mucuna pruriens]